MKVYSIVDRIDNNTIITLEKAGVKDRDNIYNINAFAVLAQKVEPNDKVIIISIRVFHTLTMLAQVFGILKAKGVTVKILNESKLSFSTSQPLKAKYNFHIQHMLNNEQIVLNQLERVYQRTDRREMFRLICFQNLVDVSITFGNDGILQR